MAEAPPRSPEGPPPEDGDPRGRGQSGIEGSLPAVPSPAQQGSKPDKPVPNHPLFIGLNQIGPGDRPRPNPGK